MARNLSCMSHRVIHIFDRSRPNKPFVDPPQSSLHSHNIHAEYEAALTFLTPTNIIPIVYNKALPSLYVSLAATLAPTGYTFLTKYMLLLLGSHFWHLPLHLNQPFSQRIRLISTCSRCLCVRTSRTNFGLILGQAGVTGKMESLKNLHPRAILAPPLQFS